MPSNDLPKCCEECGDHGSLYLHSRCHPDVPTWSVLTGNVLTIQCAECENVIVRLKVSDVVKEETIQ
jgi:hypothetical protein